MNIDWADKEVLITGGTGTLGYELVSKLLLQKHSPKGIRIYSRDEYKQSKMNAWIQDNFSNAPVSFLIGDVRDEQRMELAMQRVDTVIHAAALKQVPIAEENPLEVVKTNILGTQNVINAALKCGTAKVMYISTDKAVYPVNLYGATKAVAEKLIIQANIYTGGRGKFACVRYGNVFGSRGSVVPLFIKQAKLGEITITDKRMTRFWTTISDAADFVLQSIDRMEAGQIFIPKLPSMSIMSLIKAITPSNRIKEIGIRPGEKLHECLIAEEEDQYCLVFPSHYIIDKTKTNTDSTVLGYYSNANCSMLTSDTIRNWVKELKL